MEKFHSITAKSVPLPLKDVDTDLIIPAQYLTSVSKGGYGKGLFQRLRSADPQFPLNLKKFSDAQILISDSNFGCGSSREHAVWALVEAGFQVVIAKSFADIFYNNAAKNGLVLVTLAEKEVDALLRESVDGNCVLTVNLAELVVVPPDGRRLSFTFDPFRQHCLMNGLDDLSYILAYQEQIQNFRKQRAENIYFSTLTPNNP